MEVINTFVGRLFGYPLGCHFEWRTDVVGFDSGLEQRNQVLSQPIRHWTLPYANLTPTQRDSLVELFNRARGRYALFLFEDPKDYECGLAECSITAAGGETTTQLIKTYHTGESESWDENKKRIQPGSIFPPVVKIDAVVKTEGTHFTLDDDTGVIDWTGGSAPNGALGAGEVVTANYYFYFPVRFDFDIHSISSHAKDIWTSRDVELIEVLV